MPTLQILKSLISKNSVITILIVVVVMAITDSYNQRQEVLKARAVYQNPQVKTVEHVVYREGPVHVVTRIIREPTGTVTTETTVDRAPVEKVTDSGTQKTPVPISTILAPTRTDRYLLTLGLNKLSQDFDGKALFVGYSIKNRFDFEVGGIEHNGFSPWILATARF